MENIIDVKEVQKGDVMILHVKGKLDSILSPEIEKTIFQRIDAGHNKILLNLNEISYINSAGLRMLLSVKKHLRTLGGKFIVCSLKTEVLEIMKICGFDHVFDIYQTEEEALHHF